MMKIFAVTIREHLSQNEIKAMESLVSPICLEKINGFCLRDDYLRTLIGEVVIRIQASKIIGMHPKEIVIENNEYGKPYFKNISNLHFSISHSSNWVICALSEYKCGVDIEKKEELHLDIARCFYAENEYKMIMCVEEKQQKEVFYDLWTLKESYIKKEGRGLSIPLKSIEFEKKDGHYSLAIENDIRFRFKHLEYIKGYKIAVCTLDQEIEFYYISLRKMLTKNLIYSAL